MSLKYLQTTRYNAGNGLLVLIDSFEAGFTIVHFEQDGRLLHYIPTEIELVKYAEGKDETMLVPKDFHNCYVFVDTKGINYELQIEGEMLMRFENIMTDLDMEKACKIHNCYSKNVGDVDIDSDSKWTKYCNDTIAYGTSLLEFYDWYGRTYKRQMTDEEKRFLQSTIDNRAKLLEDACNCVEEYDELKRKLLQLVRQLNIVQADVRRYRRNGQIEQEIDALNTVDEIESNIDSLEKRIEDIKTTILYERDEKDDNLEIEPSKTVNEDISNLETTTEDDNIHVFDEDADKLPKVTISSSDTIATISITTSTTTSTSTTTTTTNTNTEKPSDVCE